MKKKLATLAFCTALLAMQPTLVQAQDRTTATEQGNDDDDDDTDFGWIGLIGLAGLLDLRKRDRDDRDVRTNPNVRT